MAEIGDDGNQLEGQQLYKHQFIQDFIPVLNQILASGYDPKLTKRDVMDTVEYTTLKATQYGLFYIAMKKPYDRSWIWLSVYKVKRIAQQRSFMQLLRESVPGTEVRRRLDEVQEQATLVGRKVSKYLMQVMVLAYIEKRDEVMKYKTMLSFLNDAFVWEGRSADFGVVFKRIDALLRHAHKEFILQVKTAEIAGGEIVCIEKLGIYSRDITTLLGNVFREIVHIISILESLLSFPLLPDEPRLLEPDVRSLSWLTSEMEKLGDMMNNVFHSWVRALMSDHRWHHNSNDIDAFLTRVLDGPRMELWEDLEREAEVKESQSMGRIRMHVEATIIRQHQNNALIQVEGINSRNEAEWYIGKVIYFFYRANVRRNGSHFRCIKGVITAPHEDSGILSADFKSLLPTIPFDRRQDPNILLRVKVYMYRAKIINWFGRDRVFIGD